MLLSCQVKQIWIDCVHVCTVVQPSISAESSRAHSMLIMLIGRIILNRVLKCIPSYGGICVWVHSGPVGSSTPSLGVVALSELGCHMLSAQSSTRRAFLATVDIQEIKQAVLLICLLDCDGREEAAAVNILASISCMLAFEKRMDP